MELAATLQATALRVVHEARCPDIGPVCAERDEPPHLHDQRLGLLQLTVFGEYRFNEAFSARLEAPLRVVRSEITYRRLNGVPFQPDYADIHHRDEVLAGFGDPLLLAGWRGEAGEAGGRWRFGVRAGGTAPVGRIEPNPFDAGQAGTAHQHLQFGAGTVMPAAELGLGRSFGEVYAQLTGRALFGVAENRHGYRPGHRFTGALSLSRALAPGLVGALLADAWGERPERWDGLVREEGNLGRSEVLLGVMLQRTVGPVPLQLAVRVPVWQHSAGSELSYPVVVELTGSHSVGEAPGAAGAQDPAPADR